MEIDNLPPDDVCDAAHRLTRYFRQRNIKDWALDGCASREQLDRLAEENARLKARIAEAPTVTLEFSITGGWWAEAGKGCPRIPQVLNGKRVRLVEDGERE